MWLRRSRKRLVDPDGSRPHVSGGLQLVFDDNRTLLIDDLS